MPTLKMWTELINDFVDAGTYTIKDDNKFDPSSLFVLLTKDRTVETEVKVFSFGEIKQRVKKGCINEANKTITFSSDMDYGQFVLAILFWAGTKNKKRAHSGAAPDRYEVNFPELVANLTWIKNKIGAIHSLNNAGQ